MKNKQYRGQLTPRQATEGIRLAEENAASLLADARLLFDNGRLERSVALTILAIEEAGKTTIIREILLTDDSKELKKLWQEYRRHTDKNRMWIFGELFSKGARNLEDFKIMFESRSTHGQTLENLKQLSLYTDAFSNCKWSTPKKIVNKDVAESILKTAQLIVGGDNSTVDSEEELGLWIKHMKPVWKQETLKMKQALINFYSEAESLGLIKKGMTKKMTDFAL